MKEESAPFEPQSTAGSDPAGTPVEYQNWKRDEIEKAVQEVRQGGTLTPLEGVWAKFVRER